jgi:hypothetical protein
MPSVRQRKSLEDEAMRALIAILAAVLASPSAWAQTVDDLDEVFYRTVFTNEALVKDYFFVSAQFGAPVH